MEDIRFGIIHGAKTLKFEEGSREFNEEGVHLLYGLKVQGKHFVKKKDQILAVDLCSAAIPAMPVHECGRNGPQQIPTIGIRALAMVFVCDCSTVHIEDNGVPMQAGFRARHVFDKLREEGGPEGCSWRSTTERLVVSSQRLEVCWRRHKGKRKQYKGLRRYMRQQVEATEGLRGRSAGSVSFHPGGVIKCLTVCSAGDWLIHINKQMVGSAR